MTETNNASMELATIMSQPTGALICTVPAKPGDAEAARIVFNALNNPTHKIKDYVNQKITVANVLVEANEILDEETGELEKAPRCVLITPEGDSYMALSKGIFNSIKNAFISYGPAPWSPAITFTVKQRSVGRGTMLTLEA